MFKSKLFEVHHNLFPQYEYAYTKWWKWFKFFINIATAAFAVLAEIFLVGSLGSKAVDTAIPIFLAGRSVRVCESYCVSKLGSENMQQEISASKIS